MRRVKSQGKIKSIEVALGNIEHIKEWKPASEISSCDSKAEFACLHVPTSTCLSKT